MKKVDHVGCQYLLVQIVIDGFGSLCSPVFLVEEWPLGTKKHHKNRNPSQFFCTEIVRELVGIACPTGNIEIPSYGLRITHESR